MFCIPKGQLDWNIEYSIHGHLDDKYPNYELPYYREKIVVFSYDDLETMYELLFTDSGKFSKRYTVSFKYSYLINQVKIYFYDKNVVKRVLKKMIIKDLNAETITLLNVNTDS